MSEPRPVSEAGVMISLSRLKQMISDIDALRAKVFGASELRALKQSARNESYKRYPYKITAVTTAGGRKRYTGKLMLLVDSEGTDGGYKEHPDDLTRENLYSDSDAAGNSAGDVAVGAIVWAYEIRVRRGSDDVREFRFSPGSGGGSLPTGEHDGQVCQMVSDSQVGYDFPRFHPVPD